MAERRAVIHTRTPARELPVQRLRESVWWHFPECVPECSGAVQLWYFGLGGWWEHNTKRQGEEHGGNPCGSVQLASWLAGKGLAGKKDTGCPPPPNKQAKTPADLEFLSQHYEAKTKHLKTSKNKYLKTSKNDSTVFHPRFRNFRQHFVEFFFGPAWLRRAAQLYSPRGLQLYSPWRKKCWWGGCATKQQMKDSKKSEKNGKKCKLHQNFFWSSLGLNTLPLVRKIYLIWGNYFTLQHYNIICSAHCACCGLL